MTSVYLVVGCSEDGKVETGYWNCTHTFPLETDAIIKAKQLTAKNMRKYMVFRSTYETLVPVPEIQVVAMK